MLHNNNNICFIHSLLARLIKLINVSLSFPHSLSLFLIPPPILIKRVINPMSLAEMLRHILLCMQYRGNIYPRSSILKKCEESWIIKIIVISRQMVNYIVYNIMTTALTFYIFRTDNTLVCYTVMRKYSEVFISAFPCVLDDFMSIYGHRRPRKTLREVLT